MDRPYLTEIFGGREYPDGTFVIDYIDEIIDFQKKFMEEVSKVRQEQMFTFPVLTYSLLYQNGKFVDEEFARWCSDHNALWCDSNFFVGDSVTSLSSCCFDGSQKILAKTPNGVIYTSFKELSEMKFKDRKNFTIFHNGSWVSGKLIKLPKRDMYKIKTMNKKEMIATDNHIFPTLEGDKTVSEITSEDYLATNSFALDTFPEKDKGLEYSEGILIGMYLGDGSIYQRKETNTPTINLSLNVEKYNNSLKYIKEAIGKIDEDANYTLNKPYNNVYPTVIRSWKVYNFVREWVFGDYCYEKELNLNCLLQSREFRTGIVDGLYMTDGGNSNRIYTTSENLAEQIEVLLTSLGRNSVIDKTDRTDEDVIIRNEYFKRNYPLYCVRWYDRKNKRSIKGLYKVKNNTTYFKVDSIEKYTTDDKYVYCFEISNDGEPYFTLPNNFITHNCRLVNQFDKLDGFINSIGGTALKIGSVKVNTINLARISIECDGDKEKFLSILKQRTKLVMDVLDVVRHIIIRNVEKGLLPNYSQNLIDIKNQYNTIGINALMEAVKNMGMMTKDDFGNWHYTEDGVDFACKILDTINELKDEYVKDKDYSVNLEAVPAERCAAVNAKKDSILYPEYKNDILYSNQWVALAMQTTLDERIKLAAILDKKCGGGQILHVNCDKPFEDKDTAWELLNYIAKSGVIYFAFNTKISSCKNGHGFYGEVCNVCGEPKTDTYSRVVGFLVPTSQYSKERSQEYAKRYWYDMEDSI